MFLHHERQGRVELAFTDGSLDLGAGAAARGELDALSRRLDLTRLAIMTQVHGAEVADVTLEDDSVPVADALVTTAPGVGLLARTADCTTIVLADPARGVIAVVHAGREGLKAGVAPAAVDRMRARGATVIGAWLGPRACGRCYEVPAAMADDVAGVAPAARATTSWGTASLDVGAGVAEQLSTAGVTVHDPFAQRCTIEDEELFSFRRQGADAGRLGAVVVLR